MSFFWSGTDLIKPGIQTLCQGKYFNHEWHFMLPAYVAQPLLKVWWWITAAIWLIAWRAVCISCCWAFACCDLWYLRTSMNVTSRSKGVVDWKPSEVLLDKKNNPNLTLPNSTSPTDMAETKTVKKCWMRLPKCFQPPRRRFVSSLTRFPLSL